MGSKKAILDFVARELERLTEPEDIIVDLMAGTHTIGYALKNRCRIVANDIQRYSLVIGQTLLNYYPQPRFEGEAVSAFKRYFNVNMRHLEELFGFGLRAEKKIIFSEPEKRPDWTFYRDFCESYPYYSQPEKPTNLPEEYSAMYSKERIKAYRTLNKLEPYNLFSLYYPNTYLGIRQCTEVDSLRYAIDKLCDAWVVDNEDSGFDVFGLRCLLISGLIAVLSRINPGPGHWAAYPRVSERNYNYMAAQRRIPLMDLFLKKVAKFETELLMNTSQLKDHVVSNEDYVVFMNEVQDYINKAKVIYLDPPYSQGHYSRFYHLIETLVHYDYPEISYTGRYRTGRHQSPFSHKEKVADAIGAVCEIARETGTILVISYSRGGIVPDEETFLKILANYYPADKVSVKRLSSEHSKLGQAKRMRTEEYIFTCLP